MGIFWPCPTEDHPGTPRLWEDKKFKTPDGKAHFNPAPYKLPGEITDEEYPITLNNRSCCFSIFKRNTNPKNRQISRSVS